MSARVSAPGAMPAWQRQLPLGSVVALVAAGLLLLTFVSGPGGYRLGLSVVAAALVLAAVLRVSLSTRRIGLLAVRSRPFDVVILVAAAAAIVVLALSLPPAT